MPNNYFSKNSRHLLFSLLILAAIAVAIWFISSGVGEKLPEKIEEQISTPTEVAGSLTSDKHTYDIITGTARSFKIIEAEVDPLDIKEGESQVVTVWVKDAEDRPITHENKVEGVVFTDNKSTPFSFGLKEVNDSNGATVATWQGSWVLKDTYDKTYMLSITAKAADREHSVDLTFK